MTKYRCTLAGVAEATFEIPDGEDVVEYRKKTCVQFDLANDKDAIAVMEAQKQFKPDEIVSDIEEIKDEN